jgi:WD40 repeat protein
MRARKSMWKFLLGMAMVALVAVHAADKETESVAKEEAATQSEAEGQAAQAASELQESLDGSLPRALPTAKSGDSIPADTCVLESLLPADAYWTLKNHDYKEREVAFGGLEPAKTEVRKVVVHFGSGQKAEVKVLLQGGRRVRLVMQDPAAPLPNLVLQTGHTTSVQSVAFSPDGRRALVGYATGASYLRDIATGQDLRRYSGHERSSHLDISFTADGQRVWVGADRLGFLREVESGEQLSKQMVGYHAIHASCVSPDGTAIALAISKDKKLHIRYLSKSRSSVEMETTQAVCLAFSPDGKNLLSGERGGELILWDAATGKEVRRFAGHAKRILSLAFSSDGSRILSGSEDHAAILWDAATAVQLHAYRGHPHGVSNVGFNDEAKQVLTVSGKAIFVWDAAQGEIVRTIKPADMTCAALSPDGRQALSGANNGVVTLWDTATGKEIANRDDRSKAVEAVQFSPNGRWLLISCLADQNTLVWDLRSGQLAAKLEGAAGGVCPAFNRDGSQALTMQGNDVLLWDVESGRQVASFQGHAGKVASAVFSPDGRQILSNSKDGQVIQWDVATAKPVHFYQGDPKAKSRAVFRPDGQELVVPSPHVLTIYSAASGEKLRTIDVRRTVHQVAYDPSGKQIAVATGEHAVVIWDAATGEKLHNLDNKYWGPVGTHNWAARWAPVTAVAFSPDNRMVFHGSINGKARLWDLHSDRIVRDLSDPSDRILRVAVSPDGRLLATGSDEGIVRLWETATGLQVLQIAAVDHGDDWIAATPEGFFDGSPEGRQRVSFRLGEGVELVPVDRFFQDFYRPGLLAEICHGERPMPKTQLGARKPPLLRIVSPEDGGTVDADMITVRVEAIDQGGGAQGPWIAHNGAIIQTSGEPTREGNVVHRDFTLPLVVGENRLEVRARSGDGSWESEPVSIIVQRELPAPPPELYLLAVGVNRYAEPSLKLNFAASDAMAMADLFHSRGPAMYGDKMVHVITLVDQRATKELIFQQLGQLAGQVRPQDTLVLMLSGHGTMVGQQYYFIPYEYRRSAGLLPEDDMRRQGVSRDDLDHAVQAIAALRRMLIIDTCYSGGAISQDLFDGKFIKAMESSNRDEGAYIFAASAPEQPARESSELGHGVLTYTLLAGAGAVREGPLSHCRIDKNESDPNISALDWEVFVKQNVPLLMKTRPGMRQFAFVMGVGDFPILPTARD